jgi:hypothetical protein
MTSPGRRVSSPPSSPFDSPDRFISRRPTIERTDSFRVGKRPESLSPSERYNRQRDHSVDPFRSPSDSRSRDAVQRRTLPPGQRATPVYHVPSFVHSYDATPVDTSASGRLPNEPIRQISLGAVWNVGGPSAAQPGSTHAVPDGYGGLTASGSNAPMHTVGFLDRDTPGDQARAHEGRLALALDIDQTRLVLRHSLPAPPTSLCGGQSKYSPFTWQNGEWSRAHGQHRECFMRSIALQCTLWYPHKLIDEQELARASLPSRWHLRKLSLLLLSEFLTLLISRTITTAQYLPTPTVTEH